MRLYRVDYNWVDFGGPEGAVKWFGTQKDVATFNREIRQSDELELEMVTEVDVPTDKTGLLSWLNANFNTDNCKL